MAVHHIGKEANRWEEQFYLGFDEAEQIEYGVAPEELEKAIETLKVKIQEAGQREMRGKVGISRANGSPRYARQKRTKEYFCKIVGALRAHTR